MASDGGALLSLIHQHLKVNGYRKAAKVLEKHVTQVETPGESSNLQDIYTGWMKLCSLAQRAKQEIEDSTCSRETSIKAEPATSEEECADVKAPSVAGDVDDKPSLDSKEDGGAPSCAELLCVGEEAEAVSEHLLDTETKMADSKDEAKPEQEVPPAGASTTAEGSSSGSSDEAEPTQNDPTLGASGQPENQQLPPDPPESSISDSERRTEQEPEEPTDPSKVPGETSGSEQTAVAQTEATALCAQEQEGATAVEQQSPAEPSTWDLTAQRTNEQPAECETPPTADSDSKSPDDGEQQVGEEISKGRDIMEQGPEEEQEQQEQGSEEGQRQQEQGSEEEQEQQGSEEGQRQQEQGSEEEQEQQGSEEGQRQQEQGLEEQQEPEEGQGPEEPETLAVGLHAENVTVPAAEEDSMTLNIRVGYEETAEQESTQPPPKESAEPCEERKTPKKKKKSKKATRTPNEDKSTIDKLGDTPLTSRLAKKKRRDKKMQEEVEEGDEDQKNEDTPRVTSSEKKAKKRKREGEEVKDDEEASTTSTPVKKKKKVKDVDVKEENSGSSAEKNKKKKKKNKKMQCDEHPAEGNEDPAKKLDSDASSFQPSSARKKHRLRKKLSLKKRLRLHKQEEEKKRRRKTKTSSISAGWAETKERQKKKRSQEETPQPKLIKRPTPDPPQEDETPKKKTKTNPEPEENSSKENNPPKVKKEKKLVKELDESGVLSDLSAEFPEAVSSPLPNKRKKKKKTRAGKDEKVKTENSTPVIQSQDLPAKKKKKHRLKQRLEEAEAAAEASTAAPTKKGSSKRNKFSD